MYGIVAVVTGPELVLQKRSIWLFKNVGLCGGDLHYNESITKYKQIKLRLQKTIFERRAKLLPTCVLQMFGA